MRSATAWGCSIWTRRAGCGARPFTAEWPWALRPFSFRERDYLPEYTGQGIALADAVRQCVSEALGRPVTGAVRLLTQPRSWGLCFNPVSFFYCFDEQEQLAAVLCEVSNTPWRERYHYVLPANGNRNLRCSVAKTFHVSPFCRRP